MGERTSAWELHTPRSAAVGAPVPLLRLTGITKSYGGVRALRGADLELDRPGSVHTLLGENGSGKSTLLGVLSGQVRADAGAIELDGEHVEFRSPVEALAHGVAMVSQETALAPHLSIGENVLLGRTLRGWRGIDWQSTHRRAAEALEQLGLQYDTRRTVASLGPDQRQLVEIARAMSTGARVLILDEPTSSLTDDQVDGLFTAVRRLSATGLSVVFVSHRLREVFALSDRITVLRDGVTVATGPTTGFTPDRLIDAMVGQQRERLTRAPRATFGDDTAPGLVLRSLSAGDLVRDIDLDVRPGEIVGLAGLVGSGRTELLETVFGCRPASAGSMTLGATPFAPRSPVDAIRRGVAYLPPDRKALGLVLTMTVAENLSMASVAHRPRLTTPDTRSAARLVEEARSAMRLKTASADTLVGSLSGGNQQKVALGKWLVTSPRVMLLDEPTRGVDVAAKADIHDRLRELAEAGAAVLVSSSESPELIELCDRIVVLARGRVAGELLASDADEAALTRLAGGHT